MKNVMKSKATERSFNESLEKFVIFNCGTSEKMWVTITILRSNLLIACIIQENQLHLFGQAIKSARGMPWHQEPMKDVTSCDKLRGGANIR